MATIFNSTKRAGSYGSSSGGSSQQSYDWTTGQDAANKVGQERSQLEAAVPGSLYDGNLQSLFASQNRIRDLKRYLAAFGADPAGIEVIPRVRLERTAETQNNNEQFQAQGGDA
jgi:hypothetical protein